MSLRSTVVDPAVFAFDTVTALTSALALLYSRLDARHRHATEDFDLRAGLWQLSRAIHRWELDAAVTDRTFKEWSQGVLNDREATRAVDYKTKIQNDTADATYALLLGENEYKIDRSATREGPSQPKTWTSGVSFIIGRPNKIIARQDWQNLRHLLQIYSPELLEILLTAFGQRRSMINELIDQLPNLRDQGGEGMQTVSVRLQFAATELGKASKQLDDYIREAFPAGG